jgi:DNA-binding response OmpR family regulator
MPRAPATLDQFGILRAGDRWTALTDRERTVMSMLLDGYGDVVLRADLNQALWPEREPDYEPRTIHVLIHRLRKQIAPLGLAIATIRTHGFMLHRAT